MRHLIATVFAIAATTQPVFADRCENIRIFIDNQTGERMRVVQIRAYNFDDGKWRTIRSRNFEVPPTDRSRSRGTGIAEDVPKSQGDRIAIRVKYRYVFGNNTRRYQTDSRSATCSENRAYDVDIPRTGHTPS